MTAIGSSPKIGRRGSSKDECPSGDWTLEEKGTPLEEAGAGCIGLQHDR